MMMQVHETPEMYQNLVLPFIHSLPLSRLQWVYNILDKKKEVDRLFFDDPDPQNGFMMHPDMKWVSSRPLLCSVHRRLIHV
jgi:m7GpppX diphosphatase